MGHANPAIALSLDRCPLLTEQQLATWLNIPATTLRVWRCERTQGPPFKKIGRMVRYRPEDGE